MKQVATRATRGACPVPPNTNLYALNTTTDSILIKEVETTVVKRERVYMIPRPVCNHCGAVKEHVVGAWFECVNESCPSNDPEGGASAIPLREEGKKLIDVKPIKEAA